MNGNNFNSEIQYSDTGSDGTINPINTYESGKASCKRFKSYEKTLLVYVLFEVLIILLGVTLFFVPMLKLSNETGDIVSEINISLFDLAVGNTESEILLNGEKTGITIDFVEALRLSTDKQPDENGKINKVRDAFANISGDISFVIIILIVAACLGLLIRIVCLCVQKNPMLKYIRLYELFSVSEFVFMIIGCVGIVSFVMGFILGGNEGKAVYDLGGTLVGFIISVTVMAMYIVATILMMKAKKDINKDPSFEPRSIVKRF